MAAADWHNAIRVLVVDDEPSITEFVSYALACKMLRKIEGRETRGSRPSHQEASVTAPFTTGNE